MRLAVVLCLVAFAGPVAASDLAFDPRPLTTCLEDAVEPATCIGVGAEACTEQDGGYTTLGFGFCYAAERDWWDAELNDTYRRLMSAERAVDDEMEKTGAAVPRRAPALRAMQHAWITYRDTSCAYAYVQFGGGTGGGPAHAACEMTMTARQALALQAHLAGR